MPISVKGVLVQRGRVLVLRNERGEWELPGGRLDDGETPEEALTREIREEAGLTASVGSLVDVWVFEVTPGKEVLILWWGTLLPSLTNSVIRDPAVSSLSRQDLPVSDAEASCDGCLSPCRRAPLLGMLPAPS